VESHNGLIKIIIYVYDNFIHSSADSRLHKTVNTTLPTRNLHVTPATALPVCTITFGSIVNEEEGPAFYSAAVFQAQVLL